MVTGNIYRLRRQRRHCARGSARTTSGLQHLKLRRACYQCEEAHILLTGLPISLPKS